MAESVWVRAKAITHFLHTRMREGYQMEKAMAKGSKEGGGKGDGMGKLDSLMRVLDRPGKTVNLPGVEVTRGGK